MSYPDVSTRQALTFCPYSIPIFVIIMTVNPYATHNKVFTICFYYFRYLQVNTFAFRTLC